jgi:hypothetical protein
MSFDGTGAKPLVAEGPPPPVLHSPSVQELFLAFLRLGLTAFGGPSMVAYIRKLAVERKGWLSSREFTDGVALCQMIPGRRPNGRVSLSTGSPGSRDAGSRAGRRLACPLTPAACPRCNPALPLSAAASPGHHLSALAYAYANHSTSTTAGRALYHTNSQCDTSVITQAASATSSRSVK